MATQADFGWELPDLSDVADGPDAFLQFADDIAATLTDRGLLSYTPTWTTLTGGGSNPSGLASRTGLYRIRNGVCEFSINFQFGPNTSGGSGHLAVGLPVPARSDIPSQNIICTLYTPGYGGSVWTGFGTIDQATSFSGMRPHFPIGTDRADSLPWSSYGSQFTLKAIPFSTAYPYSVQNGGVFTSNGRYFAA